MAGNVNTSLDPLINLDGGNTSTNPNQFPLIPGGFGNPTGASTIGSTGGVLPIDGNLISPNLTAPAAATATPIDGNLTPTIPMGDNPIVPVTTPTNPNATPTVSSGSTTNLANMNVAQGLGLFNNPQLAATLDSIFGPGFGSAITSYINNGAGYNPQVAQALINQMKPLHDQGNAAVREAFGAAGDGYSSSAALGLSDFESKFGLNEQGVLANLYNESANRESNVFTSMFDAASLHEANKLSTFDKVSQGLGLGKSVADLLKQILGGGKGGGGGSTPGGSAGNNASPGNLLDVIKGLFNHGSNIPTGGQGLSQFPGFSNVGNPPSSDSLGLGTGIDSELGNILASAGIDPALFENVSHGIDVNPSDDGSIDWSALWGSMDSAGDIGVASGYDSGGGGEGESGSGSDNGGGDGAWWS